MLADGGARKMKIGSAAFQIRGNPEKLPCTVVFAPEASLYLLGATTLENFGVDADPVEKRLKPILAIMGGFLASR